MDLVAAGAPTDSAELKDLGRIAGRIVDRVLCPPDDLTLVPSLMVLMVLPS